MFANLIFEYGQFVRMTPIVYHSVRYSLDKFPTANKIGLFVEA
jgi:hypothetical protein